jgi:hypothetical protein
MKKSQQIKDIEHLNLTVDEIEKILDNSSIADEVVDFIIEKFKKDIETNHQFLRIRDLVKLNDLTLFDEQNVDKNLNDAAKRSFCNLMIAGKLSKLEIIYFIKNKLVPLDDIILVLKKNPSKDFIDVLLRWNPTALENFREQWYKYNITDQMIDKSKRRIMNLKKFLCISDEM